MLPVQPQEFSENDFELHGSASEDTCITVEELNHSERGPSLDIISVLNGDG